MRLFFGRRKSVNSTDGCIACSCCSDYHPTDTIDENTKIKAFEILDLISGTIILIMPIVFTFPSGFERALYLISLFAYRQEYCTKCC